MKWRGSGGKCTRVRVVACTGPLLPAVVCRAKDVHRPTFPDREGVLGNYPKTMPAAAITRAEETG